MRSIPLDSGWRFRRASPDPGFERPNAPKNPWLPAEVPGHVHLDLLRNGVIADPFFAMREAGCQWVDGEDWEYRLSFDWAPQKDRPRRVLRFDGLDTICSVRLNGDQVARSDNMFVPLEIDVSRLLMEGENELSVILESAVRVGLERRERFFAEEGLARDIAFFDERAFVRKAQYMSGWDWGPRLVSCGIWGPVNLLEFSTRIVSFEVFQEPRADGRWRVWSETVVDGPERPRFEFDGAAIEGREIDLVLHAPKLWWPNGEGSPNLYTARAILPSGHALERCVGIRSIELIREKDEFGESFQFAINGRRIWCRGANWIPNDSFPSRIESGQIERQVQTCRELGANMLRVWGGGLYESEAFYDACDRNGILVWQDFPFACSYYPDHPPHLDSIAAEAEHHVRRLRSRASLALWCGNNENETMWEGKWGGLERSPPRYCGEAIYADLLPSVLHDLDPGRPYLRSSPMGPASADSAPSHGVDANIGGWGDQHFWEVWHRQGDWVHYRDSKARFCSEFGFASSCSGACWDSILPEGIRTRLDSPLVAWHDKTGKPDGRFRDYVALHYPESRDLEEWTYFSQLNQRDALRCAIERYRMSEFCKGALIWQFNDCWPVQSWSIQDSMRLLKPAGFELARLFAPTVLAVDLDAGSAAVGAAHDGPNGFEGTLVVEAYGIPSATREFEHRERVRLATGERRWLTSWDYSNRDPRSLAVSARFEEAPESRTWRTLAGPKQIAWSLPVVAVTLADALFVRFAGFAFDAVVQDPDDWANLAPLPLGLSGSAAISCLDEERAFAFARRPKRIRVRSLGGPVDVSLE